MSVFIMPFLYFLALALGVWVVVAICRLPGRISRLEARVKQLEEKERK
jgi:hypothetical protein